MNSGFFQFLQNDAVDTPMCPSPLHPLSPKVMPRILQAALPFIGKCNTKIILMHWDPIVYIEKGLDI